MLSRSAKAPPNSESSGDPSHYRKVQPGEPFYAMIQDCKRRKVPVCDASGHNHPNGCPNPKCWKHGN